jgi:hypothetical protein
VEIKGEAERKEASDCGAKYEMQRDNSVVFIDQNNFFKIRWLF